MDFVLWTLGVNAGSLIVATIDSGSGMMMVWESCTCLGAEGTWEISVLSAWFCCELKITQKRLLIKKINKIAILLIILIINIINNITKKLNTSRD